jgi:inhibitor of growth protein 3
VESVLSVTSHLPHNQQPPANSSRLGATQSLSRAANTSGASRRSKPRHQDSLPFDDTSHDQSRNRDIYNAPATSSSVHPSSVAYVGNTNGLHGGFDVPGGMPSATGDWASGPSAGQLEGPGMPVARGSSHPALAMTGSTAIASSKLNTSDVQVAPATVDGGAAEGGEAEGDGDDKTYCVCDGVSYGEMIACDEIDCEREWVNISATLSSGFQTDHLLPTVPSRVYWTCRASRWNLVL